MSQRTKVIASLVLSGLLCLSAPVLGAAKKAAKVPAAKAPAAKAATVPPTSPAQPVSRAALSLKETLFDFGVVMEGDTIEHVFEVANTGADPLVIDSVKPG